MEKIHRQKFKSKSVKMFSEIYCQMNTSSELFFSQFFDCEVVRNWKLYAEITLYRVLWFEENAKNVM